MQLALAQADLARGRTAPRPPVGAVIVRDGYVVGAGHTQPCAGPHAEVMALAQAGDAARGGDLYVTLEPCCHYGMTPPCTDAVLAAGIARVFVATLDPNPRVNGQGAARLRAAGVEVQIGDGAAAAWHQLAPFFKHILTGQPYILAKWAMTLDGCVATATGDARWVSGPAARAWVHDQRDTMDAIMIGAGTARQDDPALTVRLPPGHPAHVRLARARPPLRVVLGGTTPLPPTLQLWSPANAPGTLLVLAEGMEAPWVEPLITRGVEVVCVAADGNKRPDPGAALAMLGKRGALAVLLEGGPTLLGTALAGSLVDEVAVFVAPRLVGDGIKPTAGWGVACMADALHLREMSVHQVGDDMLVRGVLPGTGWRARAGG